MKDVLAKLFATPTEQLFGDVVRGKHGGIVILASGNPGVGKTLTAEIYAEIAQRPLYVLEFGELGTTVEAIERSLEAVFARVVRWHAVLQFDECEIFLAQRGDDLERSAIVGIFLRMLDYYEGLLFLTTNRPETLDYAIRSRVMLRLEYPDLDAATRADVWRTMFRAAGLRLAGEGDGFAALAEPAINGRQIRNLVRLARILHPDGSVTARQMLDILEYGCR
jgi:SpoVK/Ycf46/Vps4 family AAA+-type ATPase